MNLSTCESTNCETNEISHMRGYTFTRCQLFPSEVEYSFPCIVVSLTPCDIEQGCSNISNKLTVSRETFSECESKQYWLSYSENEKTYIKKYPSIYKCFDTKGFVPFHTHAHMPNAILAYRCHMFSKDESCNDIRQEYYSSFVSAFKLDRKVSSRELEETYKTFCALCCDKVFIS